MTTSPMLDHEERARAVVLREILNRGECGECEGVGMIPTENNGIGVCPGCADVPTPGEMGNEALYLLPRLLDALEAVERERDRAEEALRGIVFKCSDVVNAARWSVGNGGGHVCDFRAAVQSCHDRAAKIVGRQHLSDARRIPGLGARTPEGGTDGE